MVMSFKITPTDPSSDGCPDGRPGLVASAFLHRRGLLRNAPQRLLMALVRGYRLLLSPWLGSSCRFEPTCSAYALQALAQHGAASGARLTLGRLARCHPWCAGGCDPVPDTVRPIFSALLGSARPPAAPETLPGVVSPSRKN
jgi:uncharacterized protein